MKVILPCFLAIAAWLPLTSFAEMLTANCSVFQGDQFGEPVPNTIVELRVDPEDGDKDSPTYRFQESETNLGDYKIELSLGGVVSREHNSSVQRRVWDVRVYDQSTLQVVEVPGVVPNEVDGKEVFQGAFRGYAAFSLDRYVLTKSLGGADYFLSIECESKTTSTTVD